MVKLNLEIINAHAPYEVHAMSNSVYYFDTAHDVRCVVSFDEDDFIESDESYQLIVGNPDNRKSPLDNHLSATIIEIITDFFRHNNHTVLYICETGDGKQGARSRLFHWWYEASLEKERFYFAQAQVKDEDGATNYAAIICRTDNPKMEAVAQEFARNVKMFNDKP